MRVVASRDQQLGGGVVSDAVNLEECGSEFADQGAHLGVEAALLVDDQRTHADEAVRKDAGLLLDFLTPVIKSFLSDRALEANDAAIQIHGGAGYTRDFPVEQFWRDNRLNPIHEGANGIQAIDLMGRKLGQADGRCFALFRDGIAETVAVARSVTELRPLAEELQAVTERFAKLAESLLPALRDDPRRTLANAAALVIQVDVLNRNGKLDTYQV